MFCISTLFTFALVLAEGAGLIHVHPTITGAMITATIVQTGAMYAELIKASVRGRQGRRNECRGNRHPTIYLQ
jgi:hypothetical protein